MAHRTRLLPVLVTAAFTVALLCDVAARTGSTPEVQSPRAAELRWFVLVDDLHLDFVRTGTIRRTVTAVIQPLFEVGVLAAVRSDGPSPLSLTTHETTTWSAVADALKRISGNALKAADIIEAIGGRRGPTEVVYRAQLAGEALSRLVRDMDGRPAVVLLVSHGYRTDIPGVRAHLTAFASTARRANARVVVRAPDSFASTADPDPSATLPGRQQHQQALAASLQQLTDDTGGTMWVQGDTLASVQARLAR